jgi:hypothetical protein
MALSNSFMDNTSSDSVNALFKLTSNVDLYHLLAGNLELISLYLTVNEQILEEATSGREQKHYSRLFNRTTSILKEIKEALSAMQCQVKFRHMWLPKLEQDLSVWDFFNMINEASEKPAEADNSRLFFRNY